MSFFPRLLLIVLLQLSASSFVTAQSTIRVDNRCSLADAIHAANSDRSRGGCNAGYGADSIELTRDVTLRSALPSIRSNITIYGNWHTISGNNRYQIFQVNRGAMLTLQSVELTNGRGVDDGDLKEGNFQIGGAIRNDGALHISDAVFRDNYAEDAGGAILNTGETTIVNGVFESNRARVAGALDNWDPNALMRVSDSEFRSNVATQYGGAIDNGGSLTIRNSAFYDNDAAYGGAINNFTALGVYDSIFIGNIADSGGAIRSSRNEATTAVSGSEFSDNRAHRGGAIYISAGFAEVFSSAFHYNSATPRQGNASDDNNRGGAISSKAETHIRDAVFNDNYASAYGGALNNEGHASISDSSFNSNRADYSGGGMSNLAGEATVTGSAFASNSAYDAGGGVYGASGLLTIERSSFFDNDAPGAGGISLVGGALHLRRSLLANNYAVDCRIDYSRASLDDSRDNHIADGSCSPRWRGPAYDGYCPPNQYRSGACQIGAPPILAQPLSSSPDSDPEPKAPSYPTPPPQVVYDGIVVDSYCSLADAIRAVNQDRDSGGCRASYGADAISLAQNVSLWDELPPITSNITLSGNGHTISGEGRYRIFTIESGGALSLNNLTLAHGYAADDGTLNLIGDGGAILNLGALEASDCEFRGNRAGEDGGAIRNVGTATISNCHFMDNSADRQTGAIYSADTSSSGDSSSLRIQDSSFRGNRSSRHGGAIFVSGSAHIDYSEFSDNAAGISAGALYNVGQTQISRSQFRANRSQKNAGAIFNDYQAHITISDSEFQDNSTVSGGGGLFTYGRASATITNSRFYGNAASQGGGVMAKGFARGGNTYYGEISLRDNSFSNNRGGGCHIGEYGDLRQNQGNSFDDGGCWR